MTTCIENNYLLRQSVVYLHTKKQHHQQQKHCTPAHITNYVIKFTQWLKLMTSNSVYSLGFAKAHHKLTPRGKVGVEVAQGSSPKLWGSLKYFCNG